MLYAIEHHNYLFPFKENAWCLYTYTSSLNQAINIQQTLEYTWGNISRIKQWTVTLPYNNEIVKAAAREVRQTKIILTR